jgi:hypothetical protein
VADGLDRQRLDHQPRARRDEAEPPLVQASKASRTADRVAQRHAQRRVGPGVFHQQAGDGLDADQGHVLGPQRGFRLARQGRDLDGEVGGGVGQRPLDRRLAQGPQVGQPHAVGRQHPRERVDHHLGHAQGVGHQAGVLAARPAEAGQDILGDVVAALDRDLPHGLGHVLHGDGHEALGDLDRRHGLAGGRQDLAAIASNFAMTMSRSSGWSALGPNTAGKKSGDSLPSMTLQSVTVSGPPRR